MSFTAEAFNIALLLLPGFFASKVYGYVISRNSLTESSKILESLAFSFGIYLTAQVFKIPAPMTTLSDGGLLFNGRWYWALAFLGIAITLPLLIGWLNHKDHISWLLRKIGITDSMGYESVWYGALKKHNRFLLLHLKDGRRICGFPHLYPREFSRDFLLLTEPEWVTPDGYKKLQSTWGFLCRVADVEYFELMLLDGEDGYKKREDNNV